ncbi:MAG: amidohydrolase family protein [Eubacteriales bacterium]|nr:amidohydrolase family protein [Eubacteriales bacterium]
MYYIDAHAHIGDCRVFDMNVTEKQFLHEMEKSGVDAAILQPFPGAFDYLAVHDQIYRMSREMPGKIYGLVSINPHKDRNILEKEVRHYVEDCGFVGIKLHTQGHAVHPGSRDAHALYEIAAGLKIPVNVHTGLGVPFAMPSLLLPIGKQYPEITFVVAHSGTLVYSAEAVILANECENVYLDTTMCVIEDLLMLKRELGAEKLIFASDSLKSMTLEQMKFRAAEFSEEDLKKVFYRNAAKVFGLDVYKDL